ncbi:MAG: methyltransferase [Aeromicrobium sp.]
MLDTEITDRLRAALEAAEFTADATYAMLGDQAHHALGRNQVVPALRATRDGSALATLVRLFTLQVEVPAADAKRALPGLVDPLVAGGLLLRSGGHVRALVYLRPYCDEDHDWWVACDATPGLGRAVSAMDPQHVLGISEASSSLAQLVIRENVESALDLGTGCGVQALHLAQHAHRVVATDVNPRALDMARLTAALNEVEIDVRDGSLFDPVAGERFDLIATNPPFVISPPGSEVLVYRDSGMPGDAVVRHLVERASDHLNPGGWCQILANWAHRSGSDWTDDIASWLEGHDLDSWVVQREQVDPAEYVEMWLSDAGVAAGPEHTRRYDEWLSWFESEGITGVGFGWLSLRRTETTPTLRLEEWAGEIAPPVGPTVARWGRVVDELRGVSDEDLLARHLRATSAQVQQTRGPVGAEDPEQVILQLQQGVRRTRQVDTVEAALVGACDGDLSVGQILDAIGSLLARDDLRTTHLPAIRDLVVDGFLDL